MKKKTKEKMRVNKYKKSIDCNNPKGFSQTLQFLTVEKKMRPSPSRKMVNKMKKRGNTSVPYGSGYKKVNEQKQIKKVIGVFGGRFQPFHSGHLNIQVVIQTSR